MSRRLQLERLDLELGGMLMLFNTQDDFTYIELHATGKFRRTGGLLDNIARCVLVGSRGASKIREVEYGQSASTS